MKNTVNIKVMLIKLNSENGSPALAFERVGGEFPQVILSRNVNVLSETSTAVLLLC